MVVEEVVEKVEVEEKEAPVKKTVRKKPGPKVGSRRKRRARRKVAKVAKRGPGRPRKKRPGRPAKTIALREVATRKDQITLPVNEQTDLDFWSNMLGFLNENKERTTSLFLTGRVSR